MIFFKYFKKWVYCFYKFHVLKALSLISNILKYIYTFMSQYVYRTHIYICIVKHTCMCTNLAYGIEIHEIPVEGIYYMQV